MVMSISLSEGSESEMEWNHHWTQQPWFSVLSYLTLEYWAILLNVTFIGYPRDPRWGPVIVFWTLLGSESEMDITSGLNNPDLVYFHTSHYEIEQTYQNWPS